MQREKIVTGSILIGLGLWFLLANMGIVSWDTLGEALRFWPLLLVIFGLDLMVRKTKWWFVSVLLAVLAFSALIGFGLADRSAGSHGFSFHPWRPEGTFRPWRYFEHPGAAASRQLTHPLPGGARSGRVKLSFGAAEVKVAGGSAGFYDLDSTSNLPEPPMARYSLEGDVATVRLWQPGVDRLVSGGISEWDVKLTERLPLSLEVSGGASDLDMDLSRVVVRDLDLRVGASDVSLRLGRREPEVRVSVSAGASSVGLEVPRGAGVKVESKGVFTGDNLAEQGFVRQDGYYATPGYDKAAVHIVISLSSAAGDLSVNFY